MSCWGYIGNQWLSLLLLEVSPLVLFAREGGNLTVSLYTLTSRSRKTREETLTRNSAGTWIPGTLRSLVLLACEVNPSQGSELSSQFADLLEKGTCSLPRPWPSSPSCTGGQAQEDPRGGGDWAWQDTGQQCWLNPLLSVILSTKYIAKNCAAGKATSLFA